MENPTVIPAWLDRVHSYVEMHLRGSLTLDDVAREAGYERTHFCRKFRAATGLSFSDYVARTRVSAAKQLLLRSGLTVDAIAEAVGLSCGSSLARIMRRVDGVSPSEFRREATRLAVLNSLPTKPNAGSKGANLGRAT